MTAMTCDTPRILSCTTKNLETEANRVKLRATLRKSWVQSSAWRLEILTDLRCGFPQSLQTEGNVAYLLELQISVKKFP